MYTKSVEEKTRDPNIHHALWQMTNKYKKFLVERKITGDISNLNDDSFQPSAHHQYKHLHKILNMNSSHREYHWSYYKTHNILPLDNIR